MVTKKELLPKLTELLIHFEKSVDAKGRLICQKELHQLHHALATDQIKPILLIITMNDILQKIDKEEQTLEKEMQGVSNYSDYEYMNVINFTFKKDLKETLIKMLVLIQAVYPELINKTKAPSMW